MENPRAFYGPARVTASAEWRRADGRAAGVDAIVSARPRQPARSRAQTRGSHRLVDRAERRVASSPSVRDVDGATSRSGRVATEKARHRSALGAATGRALGYPFGTTALLELGRGKIWASGADAPREFTRTIERVGFEALEEQRELPELDLSQVEHRAAFDQVMKEHPHGGANPDNLYAAQVVWDETMAHDAAAWLRMRRPARQLVIIAGQMHCRKNAVPDRIARRTPVRTAAVLPVVTAEGEAKPDLDGFDYGFVMTTDESPLTWRWRSD